MASARLGPHLEENIAIFKALYYQTDDLVVRRFRLGLNPPQEAAALYLTGTVNETAIALQVIDPLTRGALELTDKPQSPVRSMSTLSEHLVSAATTWSAESLTDLNPPLAAGGVAVLVHGVPEALVVLVPTSDIFRSVAEPDSSPVVRGSREGFVESLERNMALLRHRIQTPELSVRYFTLGRRTQTRVAMLYLNGVAKESLVAEVGRRVEQIDMDSILDTGYIEELIQDHRYSLFPTIQATERVDVVSGNLLEGRVAILANGSPFALVMPVSLVSLLQISEDYNLRWPLSTFMRLVRYLAAIIAFGITAFYVGILSFNHELIPLGLILRLAGTRAGVPFPAVVEALLLEVVFEIIREAGLRMPRQIGQAVSIVGVLVLGEAAVRAGIVGPVMIIMVGAGALASFAIPDYTLLNGVRVARFGALIAAGTFGLFGWISAILFLLTHLATLKSFGVPYLSPAAPLRIGGLVRDGWFRAPWWSASRRPSGSSRDRTRKPTTPPPGSPQTEAEGSNE